MEILKGGVSNIENGSLINFVNSKCPLHENFEIECAVKMLCDLASNLKATVAICSIGLIYGGGGYDLEELFRYSVIMSL